MRDWTFIHGLDPGDPREPRIRVRLVTDRGRVHDFSAQLEIRYGKRHVAIARYDGSHGRPHRDLLDQDGYDYQRVWLDGMTNAQAATHAIADFEINWASYANEFERREGLSS